MLQTEKQSVGAKETGPILGTIGGGMSFAVKQELLSLFLSKQADIIIYDPKDDYMPFAARLQGQQFKQIRR